MSDLFAPGTWQTMIPVIAMIALVVTSITPAVTFAAARVLGRRGPPIRSAILRGGLVAFQREYKRRRWARIRTENQWAVRH
jgi:hypothetical protein